MLPHMFSKSMKNMTVGHKTLEFANRKSGKAAEKTDPYVYSFLTDEKSKKSINLQR